MLGFDPIKNVHSVERKGSAMISLCVGAKCVFSG